MNGRRVARWLVLLVVCLLAAGAGAGGRLAADDAAPTVVELWPAPDATGVALDAALVVTFSEPVDVAADALSLRCERSQYHTVSVEGDGQVFTFTPDVSFALGEQCTAFIENSAVTDQDADDPPDDLTTDTSWSFHTALPPLLINEIDAVADEAAEFIELYDGGAGQTSLDGLTLVLYRGDEASVYLAIDLSDYHTDNRGYFVAGAVATPADLRLANGTLRDGPDAAALYAAPRSRFPVGGPVVLDDLLDAVVYAPDGQTAPALMALLLPDQSPVDEAQRGAAGSHAAQRVPNGGGQPRATAAFAIAPPTPDEENRGWADAAPTVVTLEPLDGAVNVAVTTRIEVTFSEPVLLGSEPLEINCDQSGLHLYGLSGSGDTYRFYPNQPLARGESCMIKLFGQRVHDVDLDDPPDGLTNNVIWSFTTAPPVAGTVLINEIDADTPGSDTAEFIELYDGGTGATPLDGLFVVLFNGSDDSSYRTIDLTGYTTDAAGYFLLANAAVGGANLELPNGLLQNGPDAIALVDGWGAVFPNGTPVAGVTPLDAVVYGSSDEPDVGLLPLLNPGQSAVDEDGRSDGENHSNQRCPNGAGGARNSGSFRQNTPTPRKPNNCITDVAPTVVARAPAPHDTGIGVAATIDITFSEPVDIGKGWLTIVCSLSGPHEFTRTGGPMSFVARPAQPFAYNETCTATLKSRHINDLDTDDPPDELDSNLSWQFATGGPLPDFLLINEIDPDTTSSDVAEFIELYDGGVGSTPLDGLVLVFYNGYANTSYRAIDLDGQSTNAAGYWLAGNVAITPDLIFPDGSLQNGPDAVALYAGNGDHFPTDTPLRTAGLIDAVVYGDANGAAGLLPLLLSGETTADEAAGGAADRHALQRCPNGAGGQRRTAAFRANNPTPGEPSICVADTAPTVTAVTPADGATQIAADSALTVSFSEPVSPTTGWLRLTCAGNEVSLVIEADGPDGYRATPTTSLPLSATCRATIAAALVHDADTDDPPDTPSGDYSWAFTTTAPVAGFMLINELDADTPGNDTAEFIELYDGGGGSTQLDGLVLVFYNGYANTVYYALDLDGERTNANGYWLAGNAAIDSDLSFPDSRLQNGPDAIALYAGDAAQFPASTPLRTAGLIDAIVYGDAAGATGLLPLLLSGQTAVDEAARGAADRHALQRCPNGAGGQRRTAAYRANTPTPGAPSDCTEDAAPIVTSVTPVEGAMQIGANVALIVSFSEPIAPAAGWLRLTCAGSEVALNIEADSSSGYRAAPAAPLPHSATCRATIAAALVHDADSDDPPDTLSGDYNWTFTTAAPVADFVLINELDADTPGNDKAEFIELYDGGAGHTDLSGLVLVLFNGQDDRAYTSVDLDGTRTDADGFALIGSAGLAGEIVLPAAVLQNGADAVALYEGDAADFPSGTAITMTGLRDAIVYGTADPTDAGLLPLLVAGESQVDEAGRGAADLDSSQRCPDGGGGIRRTSGYRPGHPTPGTRNVCVTDDAPTIVNVNPPDGSNNVAAHATLTVTFSEDVTLAANWFTIACATSGNHEAATNGGPIVFTLSPTAPFAPGESCTVTLRAAAIADRDADDPPDKPAADFDWSFLTAAGAPTGILINELDSDTPGGDTAEFIELYDGGRGHVDLSGLVVVLWNGQGDVSYAAIDLLGQQSDGDGYFVLGSSDLPGVDLPLAGAALQNGPDAVALYAGRAADFANGAPLTIAGLRDAVVYGPAAEPDSGLLALLETGQPQVDEATLGNAPAHALQRCPNGDGGPRRTAGFRAAPPSPGQPNPCPLDAPPAVAAVRPAPNATGVSPTASLTITFSEAIALSDGWIGLRCGGADQPLTTLPGDATATATPAAPLPRGATCLATVRAAAVADRDSDDPPDRPAFDYDWQFTIAPAPPPVVAAFTSNSPVWIDAPVVFSNTSTGPAPLAYPWTFGDGATSTARHPSHRYTAPGVYSVSLTAGHGATTATARATVVVRPRAVFAPVVVGNGE